ncbi:endonuclease III domain-containing protein [Saccharolobus solfataricus]|uniref:DNA endonuclease III n=2 Tax=Saccharolobus solfataricus TaxID=2287 RepID=A0A0E3GVY0_SACSO|nr:DNA endonuclease III [Saccharolobus solfataricus]AKA72715.1 endonuclease III domain-containing protein [Saccharolobus solfataricus]AKA75414.1 endonuclease III domain-containing protein [Saccharolobus solfataricus]AKA78106.1 endonuclease III domain-containing protein [Saccharolobus solfataricus]AZF67228.1 endonuclease III domain-containing protein [Saccharolobus solfataricus]AZF69848.1 endonuclease III domain-containing protein [Saccharolobus solfataricus]
MLRQLLEILLEIFENNKTILKEKGWIVSSKTSYEWWDGLKSEEEIIISAILVQMSRWEIVKNKVEEMRNKGLTDFYKLYNTSEEELYSVLKGINFYKTKVKRLINISKIVVDLGTIEKFYDRNLLLSIDGIGQETADSILLFAGHKPNFPPSEYGKRVLSRVLGTSIKKKDEVKRMVEENLEPDVYKYKLLHAGIVTVGRAFCFTKKPKCEDCILKKVCKYYGENSL